VKARRAVVPDVEGLALARAMALVHTAELSAGSVLPAGAIVASHLPAAGRRVAAGIPATLFARAETTPAQAVAAAGLTPKLIRAVSPAPLGTVVGVRPAPGAALAPRATVRLIVAGRRVLYRVGRRLLLASATSSSAGRVVYAGPTRFAAAAIAPTLGAGVVAMVRRSGSDGDLCFARLGGGDLRPRCARDPRWDLGRAISWRPDGASCSCSACAAAGPGRRARAATYAPAARCARRTATP